jgi:hypothetical protein
VQASSCQGDVARSGRPHLRTFRHSANLRRTHRPRALGNHPDWDTPGLPFRWRPPRQPREAPRCCCPRKLDPLPGPGRRHPASNCSSPRFVSQPSHVPPASSSTNFPATVRTCAGAAPALAPRKPAIPCTPSSRPRSVRLLQPGHPFDATGARGGRAQGEALAGHPEPLPARTLRSDLASAESWTGLRPSAVALRRAGDGRRRVKSGPTPPRGG